VRGRGRGGGGGGGGERGEGERERGEEVHKRKVVDAAKEKPRRYGDNNKLIGYEWWLMTEAKKRNPDILLYALSWGVPGWIGNGNFFSQDNIDYHIKWVQGAKQVYGLGIL